MKRYVIVLNGSSYMGLVDTKDGSMRAGDCDLVLAHEADAALAEKDARIVELQAQREADIAALNVKDAEIAALSAELERVKAENTRLREVLGRRGKSQIAEIVLTAQNDSLRREAEKAASAYNQLYDMWMADHRRMVDRGNEIIARDTTISELRSALLAAEQRVEELEPQLAAAIWLVPDSVLVGDLRKKRDEFTSLRSQTKWLRMAADEIRREGHAGWGNTCEQAADAIDAAISSATPEEASASRSGLLLGEK